MNKRHFSSFLLDWYQENKRELPWRKTKDPYKIWLSEVLLQQTRVKQGLPYYLNFVKKFPTVKKLAQSSEKIVLRLWQGLGYYSRARNLHRCAKIISEDFNGRFPQTVDELKELPGIGDYTAAAIASLAFHQPTAVVDGNVFRVLARLFGVEHNISSPAGKKYFFELANSLIPYDQPGEFNQAMMEFGAVHCTPRNPKCGECVFFRQCIASQTESQRLFPVKTKSKQRKQRYFNYFVIRSGKKTWMQPRQEKDIWQSLYEFYLIESNSPAGDARAIQLFRKKTGLHDACLLGNSLQIRQVLSHQEIFGKFYEMKTTGKKLSGRGLINGKFCSEEEIEKLAKPGLITQYLKSVVEG